MQPNEIDSDSNTYFYEEYNAYESGSAVTDRPIDQDTVNPAAAAPSSSSFKKMSTNNLNSVHVFNRSSGNMNGGGGGRKKAADTNRANEAGLWWDEDMALNELTLSATSMSHNKSSFEFSSQYNLNRQKSYHLANASGMMNNEEDDEEEEEEEEDDDDDDMKTLEAIIKNSELFSNLASKSKNKRFSLAWYVRARADLD